MGNEASRMGDDEPTVQTAARQLAHFDHAFKTVLNTSHGPHFSVFGDFSGTPRDVQLTCQSTSFELLEDALTLSNRKKCIISYAEIAEVGWDHASSEVKFTVKRPDVEDSWVILVVPSSVEFEHEFKLRLTGMAQAQNGMKIPPFSYVGMFAGSTKPKPFQRKRPNLSKIPAGKLPKLSEMRQTAVDLHMGSYAPCPAGQSRRVELALQHIYDGHNTFPITYVRGDVSTANKWCMESLLLITESTMIFQPNGATSAYNANVNIPFSEITSWDVIDNELTRKNDSGINVHRSNGVHHYFGFKYIRDVKHTLEFFWNKFQVAHGRPVMLGSTHGRPIQKVYTLGGEVPEPLGPVGNLDIVDQDGTPVRTGMMVKPGAKAAILAPKLGGGAGPTRRSSLGLTSHEPVALPGQNENVRKHWRDVCIHQGWLLKQGGMGLGIDKQWIKRYFVLYSTSQGHFLIYYADLMEIPLYTTEHIHRNVVDLAKATYLRPGGSKPEGDGALPPHCFDIVTTEREWTLCAETQENAKKWLVMLTRAVDEDVAILPDEELEFKVKPKVDAMGVFNQQDYSTSIRVSANAVTVSAPDPPGSFNEKQQCFWVYTDFYKWSLLSQNGKIALLVNVFTDASFSKRHEFIFRSKEAVRLATAIEFFIEKFMTVMHIRLELVEGHSATQEESFQHARDDEWTDDSAVTSAAVKSVAQEIDLLGFDNDPPAPPAQSYAPAKASAQVDLFSDDPFGFGSAPAPPGAAAVARCPPLSPQQVSQHSAWLRSGLVAHGGPMYDDGSLQVAYKLEIRGSQGRMTFNLRNCSQSNLSDLHLDINDATGLLRFEAGPLATSLAAGGQQQQQIMMECMKPVFPGPSLSIKYSSQQGARTESITLPVSVTCFNEAIAMNGGDFHNRWEMLHGEQEVKEVITLQQEFTSVQVLGALTNGMRFAHITGLPDSSENVVYGAASMRTGAINASNNEKISVGCLIKVEMNIPAKALRVTCRTVSPVASNCLMQAVKLMLL